MSGQYPENWTCPHCGLSQVSTTDNRHRSCQHLNIGHNLHGAVALNYEAKACLNPDCREISVTVALVKGKCIDARPLSELVLLNLVRLRPFGAAKPQPDCVPEPLRDDYREACLVMDLSPKSAATLARRILQGMIRDFCKIEGRTLFDEIKELRRQVEAGEAPRDVSPESVEAIDRVRKIGNIGAHMKLEADRVVDVNPEEARLLIDLVERLFQDWYVARQKRKELFDNLARVADEKEGGQGPAAPKGLNALLQLAEKGAG